MCRSGSGIRDGGRNRLICSTRRLALQESRTDPLWIAGQAVTTNHPASGALGGCQREGGGAASWALGYSYSHTDKVWRRLQCRYRTLYAGTLTGDHGGIPASKSIIILLRGTISLMRRRCGSVRCWPGNQRPCPQGGDAPCWRRNSLSRRPRMPRGIGHGAAGLFPRRDAVNSARGRTVCRILPLVSGPGQIAWQSGRLR